MSLVYGKVIRIVEKDVLDTFAYNWMSNAPTDAEDLYTMYAMDANDPLAFWLYPRAIEGRDVIVTYAQIPQPVTDTSDSLAVSDVYVPTLVDYVVYRALAKDARGSAKDTAEGYYKKFLVSVGASRSILFALGQNAKRPPDADA